MSMEYCEICDQIIDTDYNAEHFEQCADEELEGEI